METHIGTREGKAFHRTRVLKYPSFVASHLARFLHGVMRTGAMRHSAQPRVGWRYLTACLYNRANAKCSPGRPYDIRIDVKLSLIEHVHGTLMTAHRITSTECYAKSPCVLPWVQEVRLSCTFNDFPQIGKQLLLYIFLRQLEPRLR